MNIIKVYTATLTTNNEGEVIFSDLSATPSNSYILSVETDGGYATMIQKRLANVYWGATVFDPDNYAKAANMQFTFEVLWMSK